MASKTKENIEYALHAYDTFWDYYKKTLDERNQILNNYLIFVGIPIAVIGIIIEKKDFNLHFYSNWFILALTIILLLGIIIYDAFIVESFVSERYLKQIRNITEYLKQNYDNTYEKVFSRSYDLNNIFLNNKDSQKQRIRKSLIIFIINTAIITGIICLCFIDYAEWYFIFLSFPISLLIHISIFIYHKQIFNNYNI